MEDPNLPIPYTLHELPIRIIPRIENDDAKFTKSSTDAELPILVMP
jgi:hypothetical protein